MCAYQRAIELDPDDAEAHVGIASLASALGRSGEAVASARKAAQLFPENGSYLLYLGWYTYEAGEYTESIDASRRAIQLTPKEPMAFFNLGLALLASGDPQGAFQEYESGLDVCMGLASHEAQLNLEGAVGNLERLTQSRPDLNSIAGIIRQKLQNSLSNLK
jgi:superkiller protein 3